MHLLKLVCHATDTLLSLEVLLICRGTRCLIVLSILIPRLRISVWLSVLLRGGGDRGDRLPLLISRYLILLRRPLLGIHGIRSRGIEIVLLSSILSSPSSTRRGWCLLLKWLLSWYDRLLIGRSCCVLSGVIVLHPDAPVLYLEMDKTLTTIERPKRRWTRRWHFDFRES